MNWNFSLLTWCRPFPKKETIPRRLMGHLESRSTLQYCIPGSRDDQPISTCRFKVSLVCRESSSTPSTTQFHTSRSFCTLATRLELRQSGSPSFKNCRNPYPSRGHAVFVNRSFRFDRGAIFPALPPLIRQ
ncbi:hypothetical protein PDE_00649 [Penicillium oxalicum 114-2]|uniref:Uncharacterized protein n=1 Tax=Penicillium oxalicum (strain 114-2 / CGMCC 5302) TaxID=933388 RepID=S7Z5C0_PENO1|nr:hypothetical protein PDE_00649 [Penicillium oxalicum 114-2]